MQDFWRSVYVTISIKKFTLIVVSADNTTSYQAPLVVVSVLNCRRLKHVSEHRNVNFKLDKSDE